MHAYRGDISHPCCMKAPSANHRLFSSVKSLLTTGPDGPSSTCRSYGLNRPTIDSARLTPPYERTIHSQI